MDYGVNRYLVTDRVVPWRIEFQQGMQECVVCTVPMGIHRSTGRAWDWLLYSDIHTRPLGKDQSNDGSRAGLLWFYRRLSGLKICILEVMCNVLIYTYTLHTFATEPRRAVIHEVCF